MLVAAMNPVLADFSAIRPEIASVHPLRSKTTSPVSLDPLLDRIDIQVEVPAVKYAELANETTGEPSAHVQERVEKARHIQQQRFADTAIHANASMESKQIREYCQIDSQAQELLRVAINQLGLSARAYDRILKVARTIADLDENPHIEAVHVSEGHTISEPRPKFLEKVRVLLARDPWGNPKKYAETPKQIPQAKHPAC